MEFEKFNKIPRLSRDCVITEKIDGTNGLIAIQTLGVGLYESPVRSWPFTYAKEVKGGTTFIYAGSRTRWVTPGKSTDNYGFASWVKENAEELLKLGEGYHYGEWWGKGIQRGYNLDEKRFSLFNVGRWTSRQTLLERKHDTQCLEVPVCHVVPVLYRGIFDTEYIDITLDMLEDAGSVASKGFQNPEGIIIYHEASRQLFKKTIENDEKPKGA